MRAARQRQQGSAKIARGFEVILRGKTKGTMQFPKAIQPCWCEQTEVLKQPDLRQLLENDGDAQNVGLLQPIIGIVQVMSQPM